MFEPLSGFWGVPAWYMLKLRLSGCHPVLRSYTQLTYFYGRSVHSKRPVSSQEGRFLPFQISEPNAGRPH